MSDPSWTRPRKEVLFVVEGAQLTVDDDRYGSGPGGYAYLPPRQRWSLRNDSQQPLPVPLGAQGVQSPSMASTHPRPSSRMSAK